MKVLFFIFMILFFSSSQASKSSETVNDRSALVLMKLNPTAYYDLSDENSASSVNALIATGMLSKNLSDGTVSLSRVDNTCEDVRSATPASRIYACRMTLSNSTRTQDSEGHLLVIDSTDESAIIIDYIYIVDEKGKESVSDARYFLAG